MFPRRSGRRLGSSTHFYVKRSHMHARRCKVQDNGQVIIQTVRVFSSCTHMSMSQYFVDQADRAQDVYKRSTITLIKAGQ
jgi:hypothetical protein